MFVKRLRLAGFKSFALPTVLEFEAGINVVVGPNGSGKSNVVDAVSWVLGSQAPTSLRGGSMEDVIFAGSEERPRLPVAEVEMTLDNSSGMLPVDLAEVTITRSADRSGTSEYRLNGAPCRLLDISELLSDAGLGRSLHAIVGQGQLDAVLHARGEERRALIEEAAQIGKFRRRKERAVRKIERVDANLTRLNDVLAELRRALRPLKRQAKAAALYSEMMAEHRELRQRVIATELHRLAEQEARAGWDAEAHRMQLLSEELAHVRARLETLEPEREELARAAERAEDIAHRMSRASERLLALGRLAQEREATCAARLGAETEEGHRARIRVFESDSARWQGEAAVLKPAAAEATTRAEEAAAQARRLADELAQAEQALAEARAAEAAAAEILLRAEGSESAGRTLLRSIEARAASAGELRDVSRRALASEAEALAAAETEVRDLALELDGATERAAAAEAALEEVRDRAASQQAERAHASAERAAAEARLHALEEVHQLLSDLPAAARRVTTLIEEARRRVQLTRAEEERCSRLIVEAERLVEERWSEVARHDEELRRLDALTAASVDRVEDLRRRQEARATELAARDDELARAREMLAAAERGGAEDRAALPAHRASLQEATAAREKAEGTVRSLRARVEQAGRRAQEAELEARAATDRALAARRRLAEAEAAARQGQLALAGLADVRRTLEHAAERAGRVAGAALEAHGMAAGWADEAQEHAREARAVVRDAQQRLTSLMARERELDERLEELARRRNDAEVQRAEARARASALAERALEEWGMGAGELLAREPLGAPEEEAARRRAEQLEREMRALGGINPGASDQYEELAQREAFLVSQIEDLKGSRRDLMKIVREVDATIVEVFAEAFAEVAREFETTFERLFPAGTGRLRLSDPADLLGSGVEIEARPAGKNVSKLSLLSGGERSLVALAFLFSIFKARPSPFYLLDEVEAALDDINLDRFLRLVQDLRKRAQVLIVTHQKRTIEVADVLYGVSMAKDGVSNVIAQRMEEIASAL